LWSNHKSCKFWKTSQSIDGWSFFTARDEEISVSWRDLLNDLLDWENLAQIGWSLHTKSLAQLKDLFFWITWEIMGRSVALLCQPKNPPDMHMMSWNFLPGWLPVFEAHTH
jgi:hypothetical protein